MHIPFVISPELREQPNFLQYEAVFSHIECNKIKQLGQKYGLSASMVGGAQVVPNIRNSSNSWLPNNEETSWIFLRLSEVVLQANSTYRFDLNCFGELLQFTRYEVGQHYKWHTDCGSLETSVRKLSLVVNLTDPRFYEGGSLEIFSSRTEKLPTSLGSVIVFPSFKEHRVTAVKSGTRFSLVSWVSGPPFR